ncbi:exodeoxyribonuclease VII small subunit [Tissierella carlieri]|uniref:exodeoxyribonuclease VII small subunit n=1 Tax=Tissierella carlieri TaxID=689904 RepID=UPI00280379B8|nr:exodeoxyribonuclease VII small subunit [uncultured Tissierella sp.]MDU5080017.1 exodeoxyribonuclease VII small subunit [Bacillota bacterium]
MKNKDLTYEEAILKLESILKELEEENCTLNDSLDKFKKGMDIYNYCNELLSKAEGEIKILLKDDNGNMVDIEFPMEG